MISTLDKIGKYLESQSLDDLCYELLKAFHNDSESLVIRNFSNRQQSYIRDICGDNSFTFSLILDELKKHNIVHYDIYTDILVLSGLNFSFVRSLNFSLNSFKRKHKLKNITLDSLAATDPCKKGFRVPSSIFPYITGAPLPENDKKALLKSNNPDLIYLEEQRRSLSKEIIRVYCSFISLADKDGLVECDSCHTVFLSFIKQFGPDSFNHQSWYNAVRKLTELKLLLSTPTGYQVTYVSQAKERYVIVPMVVFEKEFKELEISSIRMFFEIIFSLNNGENYKNGKLENLKENKAFFIKFSGSGADTIEAREKIKRTMIQIRKRYAGEFIRTLIGKDRVAALRRYFDFELLPGCVFMVKIKPEYYISKESDYTKDLIPLKAVCHKRVQTLKEFFVDIGYLLEQQDLLRIWRLLRGKTIYKLKKVLAAIKEKSQTDHLNISALHLFVASL